ncbi:PepSY domain-containing protein [Streptomyces tauricus]|uniref:PepSY domain-containing protein n=1 Tax=Streptomyces tauricus TaxID=68274 RepID=UPI001678E922|nr:PepSY domain-containing protein [Streptomyces tauricus]
MKRASLVLLTSGALVAAITGTALAGGGDDASHSRSTSSPSPSTSTSATATATPTATDSSGPASGAPSTAPTAGDDTAGSATASPTHPSSSVGSRRAGEIALSHVGSGTITEVEAETEHGRTVWSVKIRKNGTRYDVHVDRASGEITRSRTKSDDDHGDADDDSGRHGRHHD